MKRRSLISVAAIGLTSASGLGATVVSIDATVQGIFTSWGQNNKGFNAGPGNILCGRDTVTVFRNYFVFNLPANVVPPGKQVVAATMTGKLPWRGYLSVDPTETWTLFDVNPANYGVLVDEGTSVSGRTDVFSDLGSGSEYGSRVVSVADEPAPNTGPGLLAVPLTTPAFFADLNARLAQGSIAIGGSITTLVGTAAQRIFGFSGYDAIFGGRATLTLTIDDPACVGDLNSDGLVDDQDFQIFVVAYDLLDCGDAAMPTGCPSDLNGDGVVDDQDFQMFVPGYDALVCP